MADIYFDDIESLIAAIGTAPTAVMADEVAKEAEKILLKHIKSDIYGAYTPIPGGWVNGETYSRRHVLENNIKSTIEPDGTLLVTSEATASQSVVKGYHFSNMYAGSFLELLESGHMGIWKNGFARPAVSNAQKEVDNSSKIRAAFEMGLKREMNK